MAINNGGAVEAKKRVPVCPILSIGSENTRLCVQENCAWFSANTKTCIANVFAHNAILDIKQKQGR